MITNKKAASPGQGKAARQTKLSRNNSTGSRVDVLLQHLDKVRRTGPDSWMACCPAHEDRSASLSIRYDGEKTLIHCFAGCSVHEVMGAIGMEITDLFPPREHHGKPESRAFPAAAVLRAIGYESLVVCGAAVSLMAGEPFTQADRDRLILAAERIQAGLTAAGVGRHG
jgi:hypothetical protein